MAGVKGMKWGVRKRGAPKPLSAAARVRAAGGDMGLYAIWSTMNARCHNPKHPKYRDYGARGITVCEEWRREDPDGFWNFFVAVGNRPEGLSLDRKDNSKGYSPDNVRWATVSEQNRNKRPTRCRGREKIAAEKMVLYGD